MRGRAQRYGMGGFGCDEKQELEIGVRSNKMAS